MRSFRMESNASVASNVTLRAELAEILAAGVLRLRARQSSVNGSVYGESSLDFTADQSVHANPVKKRLGRHDE